MLNVAPLLAPAAPAHPLFSPLFSFFLPLPFPYPRFAPRVETPIYPEFFVISPTGVPMRRESAAAGVPRRRTSLDGVPCMYVPRKSQVVGQVADSAPRAAPHREHFVPATLGRPFLFRGGVGTASTAAGADCGFLMRQMRERRKAAAPSVPPHLHCQTPRGGVRGRAVHVDPGFS